MVRVSFCYVDCSKAADPRVVVRWWETIWVAGRLDTIFPRPPPRPCLPRGIRLGPARGAGISWGPWP